MLQSPPVLRYIICMSHETAHSKNDHYETKAQAFMSDDEKASSEKWEGMSPLRRAIDTWLVQFHKQTGDTLFKFSDSILHELPVVRIGQMALDSGAAIAGNAWGFFTGMAEGIGGWLTGFIYDSPESQHA